MKKRKPGYWPLLVLTIIFTLMTISTLLPIPGASKTCYLGYLAHCSFTPFSTLLCIALAGLTCSIRKRLFTVESSP